MDKIKFEDFKPSTDMVSATNAVFLAMAFTETIRLIVEGYQQKILSDYPVYVTEENQVKKGKQYREQITNPKYMYLASDTDFEFYIEECRAAQKAANLKTDHIDHCPLLVAEGIQRDAESVLIDAMEPLTGINKDKIIQCNDAMEKLREYIDLCLKVMAPFVDSSEKILKG